MPCSRQAAHFDNSPVRTRRRTSVHISIAASTPRASLSERGNRGSAAIVLTDNTAQLCAALFDRPGYPAARCSFQPAFTREAAGLRETPRTSPITAASGGKAGGLEKAWYAPGRQQHATHEPLISPAMLAEVPLTGLSLHFAHQDFERNGLVRQELVVEALLNGLS